MCPSASVFQARPYPRRSLREHPPGTAARPSPAAGAFPRTGTDSRCRSGGAARPSLVEGRGLGKGSDLSLEAAERAMKLYARPEAIEHYWRALELLGRLPATAERKRMHIDALLVLVELPGWRSKDWERTAAPAHLEQALKATAELDSQPLMARVEAVQGWLHQDEACLQRAVDRAENRRRFHSCLYRVGATAATWVRLHDTRPR